MSASVAPVANTVEITEVDSKSSMSTPQDIKLYVATPAFGGMLHLSYLVSIMQLAASGIPFMYDVIGNESLVQRARNMLVARFLKSDATHMLFIDSDIGFTPQAVKRLVEGAAKGKEVLATPYAKKNFNWSQFIDKVLNTRDPDEPLCSKGLDYNVNLDLGTFQQDNGYIKVLDTASGFLMISRTAFDSLAKAHPEWLVVNDIEHTGGEKIDEYHAFFECGKDPVSRRYLSEDYQFCRRLQAANIDVWVDVTSGLSHTGNQSFSGDVMTSVTDKR